MCSSASLFRVAGGEETIDLEMSQKVVISLKEESSEESEDSSKSDVIVEEESSEPEEIEEAEVVEERRPMNPLTREAMEEDLTRTRPYVFMINNPSGGNAPLRCILGRYNHGDDE